MKCIILAAGYATRLYPLTKDKPKALLPIGRKPLLDHLIDKCSSVKELDEVILVTNSRFYKNFVDWVAGQKGRLKIRVVDDGTTSNDNRLGAIGDLKFAIRAAGVNDDVLVLASDNLFDGGFEQFVEFARSKPSAACVGVYDIKDPKVGSKKYGILELDRESRITAIEEKPEKPKTTIVSMGIYYFPKASLPLIDEYLASDQKQDAPGFYVTWLLAKIPVFASLFTGRWYDIGSLEQLEEATRNYKA